ncbi:MAG: hypothetical protein ACUVWO_09340 [Thermodesulfobacteriota bacterium]
MKMPNQSGDREAETQTERYAETLERVIQKNYQFLKDIMADFQEKCRLAASTADASRGLVKEIPDIYREIQTRLKETQTVQSVLTTRYPQYVKNDPDRNKELAEIDLHARAYFSKFLRTLKLQAGEREGVREETLLRFKESPHFFWFRHRENVVKFLRNVRLLDELDYETVPGEAREKREVTKGKPRSLTLFIIKGDVRSISNLQSHMYLREHDIVERYAEDELRGILTHLREVNPLEVERIFSRLRQVEGYSEIKCLLVPIRGKKDLSVDLALLLEKTIREMVPGELKHISI